MPKAGRPRKQDNLYGLINLSKFFQTEEDKIEHKQRMNNKSIIASKNWKQQHREHVLSYHKKYNDSHNIIEKMRGYCECCQVEYSNKSQHISTKKHSKRAKQFENHIKNI